MGIHTADAIVLRRHPFRETSVILSCLTDRFGRLKGLVKGLRAQPTRHRSAMEPLTVNRIVFYDTAESQLHLISQCELLAPLAGLQRELATSQCAAQCVELVDAILPLSVPQPAVYDLLKATLERLAEGVGDRVVVRLHFVVRLLRLSGFQPQVDECTGCGRLVRARGFWSARQGGLLCPACLHEDPQAEPARPETLELLVALAEADHAPPLDLACVPLLRHRIDGFLAWRLDRPLRTMAG